MRRIVDLQTATVQIVDEEGEVLGFEPFFKTPHNHDTNAETKRTGLVCLDPSLTDQSFKEDADINNIIERIRKTGQFQPVLPEHFGDGTQIPSLFEARSRIAESNATFYNLAPSVREQFQNDPGRWESYVLASLKAGNREAVIAMGIQLPEPPEAPQEGTPAPGAPAPAPAAPAAGEPATKTDNAK